MFCLTVSWSSKMTPKLFDDFVEMITEDPKVMVKLCCTRELKGKMKTYVLDRLNWIFLSSKQSCWRYMRKHKLTQPCHLEKEKSRSACQQYSSGKKINK